MQRPRRVVAAPVGYGRCAWDDGVTLRGDGRGRWAWALVLLTGCVRNPVGPARDAGSYASKAVHSAESALSAVSTVQLVAEAGGDGKVFGSYAAVAVDQQEDAVTETTALFRSI